MSKRIVSVAMFLVLLFSFVTTTLNVSLPEAEGTSVRSNLISSQWLTATSWNKTYGGTKSDHACSVVQTGDGGYTLAGSTQSYGVESYYKFWLVKTAANGMIQWNKTYGRTYNDYAKSMVKTNDGGYAIAGQTQNSLLVCDLLLVKTAANGTMQWSKTYGGASDDYANSVVQTSDGGYALAGYTQSYGYGDDFWLVKTYANGTMQWSKTYGGVYFDYATCVVQTSDGGYALAGLTQSYGAGVNDFWLVKTNSSGNVQWSRTYGGAGNERAWSVIQTSDGGYALAGDTTSYGAGSDDFWLVKTNSSGNVQWSRTYGGTESDEASSVVQTSDGGYALAGTTSSYGAGNVDFWLVKTDSSGNKQWDKTYGGTGQDEAYCVVQTSDGGYAIAGHTYSHGAGADDFWLVKLTPQTIYIRGDGSVDPSTAPIQRNGSFYTLTDNICTLADGIVIERNNVTVDGDRYTLQGSGRGNGFYWYGGWGVNNVTVKNTKIKDFDDGVYSDLSSNGNVSGNTITNTINNGIDLLGSNSSVVSGNIVTNSTCNGISLRNSTSSVVSRNNITNIAYGIYLGFSNNSKVSGNTITNNINNGIDIRNSDNTTVSGNAITTSTWNGVFLSSSNITVCGNTISNSNDKGIYLSSSSNNNSISGNTVANSTYGVYLDSPSSNKFYHNNFLNNTQQVYIATLGYVSSWDNGYPSGGNYWSNYLNKTDVFRDVYQNVTGSDAIADAGFTHDVNNRDNYPLMGLFGSPTAKGTNVTVFPTAEVGLTFKNVTAAGSTTVNETPTGPLIPPAYNLVGQYCDLKTTAEYTGMITLRFIYNDTGMSQLVEQNLRLKHWNETSYGWEDVTTLVDTANNVIYGEASHLSIFTTHSINTNNDPSLSFQSATCAKTVVGQGFSATINVTVKNIGSSPKTFDMNLFANANMIGRQTVANLNPSEQRIVSFVWQVTSDHHKGNYTLIVGNLAGWVIVAMAGDVCGIGTFPNTLPDGKVEIKDLAVMAKIYGVNYPDPRYLANYDVDGNGKIEIKDFAIAAKNYGKIDP